MSDLYYNEESNYCEAATRGVLWKKVFLKILENTSGRLLPIILRKNANDNEVFHSTILQPFQFEPEEKKNVW